MFGFVMLSLGDSVIKSMAGLWAPTAVAAARYAIGALGLAVLLAIREGRRGFVMPRPAIQLLRGFGVATATVFFFASVFIMPLAEATAIGFTSPMITAVLAALFLGEPARREVWIATIFAFAGVLIVLRPNFLALGPSALLPLVAACGMSCLMIGNRMSAGLATPLAMQFFVAACAAPLLLLATLFGAHSGVDRLAVGLPHWSVMARCTLVAITASIAHWALFKGTSRAGASVIAPMSYVQLLVAGVLGWLFFSDRPDGMTALGAAMIMAAGIWLWHSGEARQKAG